MKAKREPIRDIAIHAGGAGLELVDPARAPRQAQGPTDLPSQRVRSRTEEDLFAALDLPYRPPWTRDIPFRGAP